jgi:DNA-binding response OmpR family regulator
VLVVEDDADLRNLYRSILRRAGYSVVDVADGLSALQTLEATRPAAIVLDLALPRLDGRDVHRELKSNDATRSIPVVVVSGTDTSDLNAEDFACILRKPLHADTLLEAVENCIRRRGSPPPADLTQRP